MSTARPINESSGGAADWDLKAMYGLIAELMINPAARDKERVDSLLWALPQSPVRESIEQFIASPASQDVQEYTATLELTPPCPLYLGAHMYDEPNSCRGAGACGRNQYMIELKAVYEHFGVSMDGGELPDFLPLMIEFAAVSLDHKDLDNIGLRRRFVGTYMQPGLPHLRKAMRKYESVYERLIEQLEIVIEEDLARSADDPAWVEPEAATTIPVSMGSPAADPGPAQVTFGSGPAVKSTSNEVSLSKRGR